MTKQIVIAKGERSGAGGSLSWSITVPDWLVDPRALTQVFIEAIGSHKAKPTGTGEKTKPSLPYARSGGPPGYNSRYTPYLQPQGPAVRADRKPIQPPAPVQPGDPEQVSDADIEAIIERALETMRGR
jgi:hypothetical protein